MIPLGSLTEADIGRKVKFRRPFVHKIYGIITSFNENYVFVRYQGYNTSECTAYHDLDFMEPPRTRESSR